jgi:hypothetical protein
MRWFLVVLGVLALAFAGAGCGGDDDSESAGDTTAITDTLETDTDEAETDETDTTDTTDTDSGGLASGDCEELIASSQALVEALSGANTGPELEEAADRIRDFAEEVPEEISDDVEVLADVFEQYVAVFGDLDLQEGEIPSAEQAQELASALATIDQDAVTEASTNITAWSQENC